MYGILTVRVVCSEIVMSSGVVYILLPSDNLVLNRHGGQQLGHLQDSGEVEWRDEECRMIHEKNLEVRSYCVCVCVFMTQLCDQGSEPTPEPEPAPKPKKENKKGKIVKKDKSAAGKKKKNAPKFSEDWLDERIG